MSTETDTYTQRSSTKSTMDLNSDIIKNGHYFLTILEKENERILNLVENYKILIETDLPEDIIGLIRSACGKATLLVTQKMEQFKGLCISNIEKDNKENPVIKNEDLQGFWDMIMLQVKHIDNLFENIEKLKENDWKEVQETTTFDEVKSKKILKRATKTNIIDENIENRRKERENNIKKMIEEKRKAMKSKNSQKENIQFY